ncbi:MAG: GNAT family N-acetyltransferase [Arenibacterium sp.]
MTPKDMAEIHALAFTQERPWSENEIDHLSQQPNVHVLSGAWAFAIYRTVADETELLTLATHPAHRRRGQGARLCQDWVHRASKAGAAKAFLEVASDNLAALSLYQRLGFLETGRRPAYYVRKTVPAADAITMILDLTKRQVFESDAGGQESG